MKLPISQQSQDLADVRGVIERLEHILHRNSWTFSFCSGRWTLLKAPRYMLCASYPYICEFIQCSRIALQLLKLSSRFVQSTRVKVHSRSNYVVLKFVQTHTRQANAMVDGRRTKIVLLMAQFDRKMVSQLADLFIGNW